MKLIQLGSILVFICFFHSSCIFENDRNSDENAQNKEYIAKINFREYKTDLVTYNRNLGFLNSIDNNWAMQSREDHEVYIDKNDSINIGGEVMIFNAINIDSIHVKWNRYNLSTICGINTTGRTSNYYYSNGKAIHKENGVEYTYYPVGTLRRCFGIRIESVN